MYLFFAFTTKYLERYMSRVHQDCACCKDKSAIVAPVSALLMVFEGDKEFMREVNMKGNYQILIGLWDQRKSLSKI